MKTKIWHPELSIIHPEAEISKEGCIIHAPVWIGRRVQIGENTKVQAFTFIPEGVWIGHHVFIGPHVCFTNDKHPPSQGRSWARINVFPWAVIGAGAIILPGINIGMNAVIGAGAVVTKDVAEGQTVVGNPARVMGTP